MKQVALWSFVVVWFFHLAVGAGGGYAILRLWPNRNNPLIRWLAIFMHATPIGALVSIVLVFFAKGVHLTWKFALAWFIGTFLMDLVRLPLIFYLVRDSKAAQATRPGEIHSGALPPAYWDSRFDGLGRRIDVLTEKLATLETLVAQVAAEKS